MNPGAPGQFESQFLTMERVAWVLDVSVRALRRWNEVPVIPYVKIGEQVIRYDPADVMAFLLRNKRSARGWKLVAQGEPMGNEVWCRIERFISDQVRGGFNRERTQRSQGGDFAVAHYDFPRNTAKAESVVAMQSRGLSQVHKDHKGLPLDNREVVSREPAMNQGRAPGIAGEGGCEQEEAEEAEGAGPKDPRDGRDQRTAERAEEGNHG